MSAGFDVILFLFITQKVNYEDYMSIIRLLNKFGTIVNRSRNITPPQHVVDISKELSTLQQRNIPEIIDEIEVLKGIQGKSKSKGHGQEDKLFKSKLDKLNDTYNHFIKTIRRTFCFDVILLKQLSMTFTKIGKLVEGL